MLLKHRQVVALRPFFHHTITRGCGLHHKVWLLHEYVVKSPSASLGGAPRKRLSPCFIPANIEKRAKYFSNKQSLTWIWEIWNIVSLSWTATWKYFSGRVRYNCTQQYILPLPFRETRRNHNSKRNRITSKSNITKSFPQTQNICSTTSKYPKMTIDKHVISAYYPTRWINKNPNLFIVSKYNIKTIGFIIQQTDRLLPKKITKFVWSWNPIHTMIKPANTWWLSGHPCLLCHCS